MSKRMKVFLIAGVCLTVFGIALCAMARAMGYHGGFGITTKLKYVDTTEEEISIPKTEVLPFTDINAKISAGNVEIVRSDGYYIEYKGTVAIKYTAENGVLNISSPGSKGAGWYLMYMGEDYRGFGVGIGHNNAGTVRIHVPEGARLSGVQAESSLGDISVSGIECSRLTVRTALGEISLKDLKADFSSARDDLGTIRISGLEGQDCDCEVSLGDLKLSNIRIDRELRLENDCGDVAAVDFSAENVTVEISKGDTVLRDFTVTGEMKVDSDLGDVELGLPAGPDRYSLDLRTDLGTITYSGSEVGTRRYTVNDAGPLVKVRNSCGDIDVIK